MHPEDILWWSKGGVLHGQSWQRIAFLRAIIEAAPAGGLSPQRGSAGHLFENGTNFGDYLWQRFSGGRNADYQLVYLENYQPKFLPIWLPQGEYQIDLIDPWEMTVSPAKVKGLSGPPSYSYEMPIAAAPTHEIELPGKARMAFRILKSGIAV